MKRYLVFIFFVFSFLIINAQESKTKITLKSGDIFQGEVVLKDDEIIMLKDNTGARFQFALSEVEKIETINTESNNSTRPTATVKASNKNFCGQFELATGNASARKAFDFKTINQLALAFGNRKSFGNELFVGIGTGYVHIADANVGLIPLFLKIQTYTSKDRTSPFVGFDSGYAISRFKNVTGGLFAKISFGINHRISYKSTIYAGISAGVYSISSRLTETHQNGIYAFDGTTAINALSLKAGFQF